MQKDKDLFHRTEAEGLNFIRFYSWQDYAVSLGYRQKDINFPGEIVKRFTGGGAVLHCPGELTYSLGLSGNFRRTLNIQQACSRISALLVDVLSDSGLAVQPLKNQRRERIEHRICFAQIAPYEIRSGDKKLVGSAQKMTRKGLFQHGSIGIYPPELSMISGTCFEYIKDKQVFLAELIDLEHSDLAVAIAASFQSSLLKQLA